MMASFHAAQAATAVQWTVIPVSTGRPACDRSCSRQFADAFDPGPSQAILCYAQDIWAQTQMECLL
ncbi:MAG: hypothetical protein NVS4B2_10560 [Chloroflexota bacterium]